jgi:hypothetical protein
MQISLGSIEVTNHQRAAIAMHYGDVGLASRERCRGFILRNGTGAIDDVCRQLEEQMEEVEEAIDAKT